MPRDSAGLFTLVNGYLGITGQTILTSQHNPPLEDIASALTGSLPRNGSAGMLANLPMGGSKITGLADGVNATDAATKGQVDAIVAGTVTLTGVQTLTNKTLTGPTLVLKQSTAPNPTADGDMQWDSVNNAVVVGDGVAPAIFVPLPSGADAGDLLYLSATRTLTRIPKGTAGQALTMNAGATAPQWATIDVGAKTAALTAGAVGTYAWLASTANSTTFSPGSLYAGSSLQWAGMTSQPAMSISGVAPSGTWQAMGHASSGAGVLAATLFLRVS